ncbi:MAG TPA: SH3 domain-containing protein [Burkholderiaceae bacterium]|nr:SH3 domain-containing protein [Burkholderiaceae bacterium]
MKLLGLLVLAVLAPLAHAQTESVMVKRAVELREAPGDGSRSLGPLSAQTPLTRMGERQGPWVLVRTAQGTAGWVHMFDIGASGGAKPSGGSGSSGGLGALTSLFGRSGGQAQGNTLATSTVGIRGLGAEDIAKAQPNLVAVGQVEGMRVDADHAREFAAGAALNAYAVPPLPAPPRPKPAAQPGGPQEAQ